MQSLTSLPKRLGLKKAKKPADPLRERALAVARQSKLKPVELTGSRDIRRVSSRRLRRIELHRSRRTRSWRVVAAGFVGLGAAYGLWYGGQIGTLYTQAQNGIGALAVAAGLGTSQIALEGQGHASDAQITQALDVTPDTILLAFDTAAAKERLEKLSWIKHAQVMRLLPSTLKVVVEERTPYAVWQNKGKTYVIDSEGVVLAPAVPDAYPELPIVVGQGAATGAKALYATLSDFPELKRQLLAAIRVGDRRWNLKLTSGLDVMLPDDNIGQALTALSELDSQRGLLNRHIASVDLRLADRVTVRLHETPSLPDGGPPAGQPTTPTASTSAVPKGNT
ncbi:cell division protein FtsQ/DivIB [Methyloligella sp. 2.7D]|uniref:cell division protein FtsQ/DivIB n=1 Tax=unclassified Methyloligella TaxID=2625955 RepID=UPI00157CEAA2|nr:cell division protein FtsQ/DivIB [Methyloligella sp. GL2]QKP77988.1 cell division protein FtsQ/DivIB [Methyloligella sp. GL2]